MNNEQKPDSAWGDGWVRHEWSDEEVAAAVAYLKKRIPREWAELEQLEIQSGDLTGAPAADIEMGALSVEYKNRFDHRDIIELRGMVRAARRRALGIAIEG
ncbi:MAG: hypothetical protein ACN6OP_05290 [Pseudomonadales bacterium]